MKTRKGIGMRRKDREKDSAFAMHVLETCEFATLSMVDLQDNPYAVPISPAILNGCIYFHSAQEGTKTDILRAHPKVCVSAAMGIQPIPEQFTTYYSSAVAFGIASEVLDEEEKVAALRAICERYAQENMQGFDDAIARSLHRTAIWKIEIQSITGKQKAGKQEHAN